MLFFLFTIISDITANRLPVAPVIDGLVDCVWQDADSVCDFVQWNPDEGKPATESTKVYVCCDDDNVYVAFKCFDSEPEKLAAFSTARDNWDGDHVWLIFDTFGDKNTAYEFCVNAAGVQADVKISQDGRVLDKSWDGVWYSAAKVTDYGYDVEMKIPFKTMRFKEGFDEWGCNFFRTIYRKHEDVSWMKTKQSEGMRVSSCGTLKGITPGKQGLNLEIYPVAMLRYERGYEDTVVKPQAGLDVGWGFASSQLSVTTYPDFAQIESDPYTINLSKYETYFQERRPFFIEKQEVFTMPINLFYSRRIGTKLCSGDEVPIIGGLKYTGTAERLNFGLLSAYTDSILTEPRTLYSAGRASLGILRNSDVGVMYAETRNEDDKQTAIGVDGMLRTRDLQFASEIAKSDSGYAEIAQLDWYAEKFCVLGAYENYDKNFDVDRIGYAPWKGLTRYYVSAGPRFFNKGLFNAFTTGAGYGETKETGAPGKGYWINGWFSPQFKNNCYIYVNFDKGNNYDMGKWYDYYRTSINIASDYSKPVVLSDDIWYTTYGFNYRRYYFASMGTNDFNVDWRATASLSFSMSMANTFEWTPGGEIEKISYVMRSVVRYALNKDLQFRVYAEPNTDTKIHQFNALVSYNFRPKSWVYFAFNQTLDGNAEKLEMTDRIAVLKIRYLFYF